MVIPSWIRRTRRRRYSIDETAIYRVASAFEKAGDWQGVRP
jgi:hypothetical protein